MVSSGFRQASSSAFDMLSCSTYSRASFPPSVSFLQSAFYSAPTVFSLNVDSPHVDSAQPVISSHCENLSWHLTFASVGQKALSR